MSISESVNNLISVMGTLPSALNTAVKKKRPEVKLADQTGALTGSSLQVIQTAMNQPLKDHVDNTLAHQITPIQLNTYSKEEALGLITNLPSLEANPISQFGDLSYLSPGVTAFFEGATTNGASLDVAVNIEDDGGLTYLRNGTNGSLLGVFYAYVPNAVSQLATPNKTNRRYQPPFFPDGQSAQYVIRSAQDVVAGRLQDSTGAVKDWFISITSGTFDDTNHTGCFVSPSDWPSRDQYAADGEVMLGNDGIYIITNITRTDAGGEIFGFEVRFISSSQMKSGVRVVPELLTGWVTQSFYGQRTNNNAIIIADKTKSLNAADNPLVLINERLANVWAFHEGPPVLSSAQRADGSIRVRISNAIYAANYDSGSEIIRGFCASFTFNPYNRTASVDSPGTAPARVTYAADGTISITGDLVTPNISVITPSSGYGFRVSARYHAATGNWYGINTYPVVDRATHIARVTNSDGPKSLYDALHQTQRMINFTPIYFNAQYGSAVGGQLFGSTILPDNKFIVFCEGRMRDGSGGRGLVLCERGAYGFTYKSQYNGSYPGWAPNVKRDYINDLGKLQGDFSTLVSEIASNGVVKTSGSHFVERIKTSGFLTTDSYLNFSGSVSVSPSVFASLTAAMRVASGLPAVPSGYSSLTIVVPQNTAIPPFGFIVFTDPNMIESVLFAELQITAGSRTGAISGMSVISVSPITKYIRVVSMYDSVDSLEIVTGGVTIYETPDSYLVGGSSKVTVRRTGSSGAHSFRFAIPKTTNRPDWSRLFVVGYGMENSTVYYTAIPSVGFGFNHQDNFESDGYTKLVFKVCARNLAEYDSFAVIDARVQVSQDVAQGWFVYFTQEIPYLLNGKYGVMPAQTIDLTAQYPDPSNSTFYVYLTGSPEYGYSYSIVNMDNGEAPGRMFLGTITTGETSIINIDVSKVTLLGMYRLSTTNKGKSIPASPGNPSENMGLLWT